MSRPPGQEGDCGHTGLVGFDPTRPFKAKAADKVFVAAGLAITLALVIWALVG